MGIIEQSVVTIKSRLGKMSDSALSEISIFPMARDSFCKQDIAFEEDKNTFAGLSSRRLLTFNIWGPKMVYSPMLEKYGSPAMNLKIVGHECGHGLRQIQYDLLTPVNLGSIVLLENIMNLSSQGYKEIRNLKKDDTISRAGFLKKSLGFLAVAAGITGATYGAEQYASYQEEKKSDRIADALVPETNMKDTFTELFQIYKDHKDDPNAHIERYTIMNIAGRFFSNHPELEERYSESEQNCKKFAKNSLLWTP